MLLVAINKFFRIYLKDTGYLEKLFETRLTAIANVGIYDAETFTEFFGQPCLFNSLFFKDFFYPIHVVCHTDRMKFSIKI